MIAPMTLALVLAAGPAPLAYRFEEVKSSVYRLPGGSEKREVKVAAGETAAPGDHVRTGWWGRTLLSVPGRAARFEISSGTRVKLATDDPAVLLVVEKGRVKAFFDALTGAEPVERRVSTPGALLAVRGTRNGVDVDASGQTTVAEIISTAPGIAPVRVGPEEFCTFTPGTRPLPSPMGPMGMNEKNWGERPAGASPQSPQSRQGSPGGPAPGGQGGMPGSPGGGGSSAPPGGMGGPGGQGAPSAGQPRGGKGP